MPSYLQIENISKSYGPKVLFEHIDFNINEGDKVALIAPNGTGKTSLLKILAGKDSSDSGGKVLFLKDIRIAFLEQDYPFDPGKSIFRQIMDSSAEWTEHLDQDHLWQYELRVTQLLDQFGLKDPDKHMSDLSGGEVKRVALTQMLASEADFYIMDEPTNDLDIMTLEILEEYLQEFKGSLIIVSHDRHFLDRLVDHLFVFCGDGVVKDFVGNYTEYRTFIKDYEAEKKAVEKPAAATAKVKTDAPRKLSWKEQQELKALEVRLVALEAEKNELEEKLSSGNLSATELQEASSRYGALKDELDTAELRWLELSE